MSMDSSPQPPLVTVVVLTYNQERYIEQAVRSVLTQVTNFPFEILIGDDCSTDGTPDVLERLNREFPQRLTRLNRDHNLGLSANLQDCRTRARGRYLAILEGDDYWIDPLKLQKQCDAMEAHPDWSMCYHACRIFYENSRKAPWIMPESPPPGPLTVYDLLKQNHPATMSVTFFRQGIVRETPPWHAELRNGDWALYILHADHGPVGFLPDVMTAYRVHQGGLWSGHNTYSRWQQTLALFDHLEEHFAGRYAAEIAETRRVHLERIKQRVTDLEKTEGRYMALQLDHIAAGLKWLRETWQHWRSR